MFNKFVDALKSFFNAKPISLQFEEMLLQEAIQKIKDEDAAREKVASVDANATVAKVKVVAKKAPKSPAKAEVAEKRTRKSGKFVSDDKSTPNVNEAFKDGKAPAKKPKKPTMKIVK